MTPGQLFRRRRQLVAACAYGGGVSLAVLADVLDLSKPTLHGLIAEARRQAESDRGAEATTRAGLARWAASEVENLQRDRQRTCSGPKRRRTKRRPPKLEPGGIVTHEDV